MAVGMMILPGCCYCRAGPVWVVPGWFKLVVVVVGWWVEPTVRARAGKNIEERNLDLPPDV